MTFLVILHIIACLALILIVLLQAGRGMGSLLGGASESFFGSLGPTSFLKKLTVGAAVTFMITSLSLAIISGREKPSILKETVKEGIVGEEESLLQEESK